ncbi:MAG: hypothetical protein AAFQ63_18655 [Cyanobacteria bacterium J06621_11]
MILPLSSPKILPKLLSLRPLGATKQPALWGIVLIGLALSVNAPNSSLKQAGSAVALFAGGATVASLGQQDKRQIEIEQLQAHHQRREASLTTALDIAMAESETRSEQLTHIDEALVNWEREKVSMATQVDALERQQRQLLCELYEIAIAENMLYGQTMQTQAAAQARIGELEAALQAKTNMATQMLTELETEATDTFNQFNAKITAQNELIQSLRQQLETLRKANAIPVDKRPDKRFVSAGKNTLSDNRVFGRQKMSRAS